MRVLFITPYYKPAHLGGIERAIEHLAMALRDQPGVEQLGVLTTRYAFPPRYVAGLRRHETLEGGLCVYRLSSWPHAPAPIFPLYSCPVTYFSPREIRRVLRTFQPDIIHLVGDGWVWVHLWLLVLRSARTALVFTPSFHDLAGSRAWLRLPNRLVARLAERTVVLTEHERQAIRAAYTPPSSRLCVISWGVNLPAAEGRASRLDEANAPDTVTVLCVGRLGEHKGQLWLLDIYRRARPSFRRPARLVFAGKDEGGPGGRAALSRHIAMAGLESEVTVAGEVDDATLDRLYDEAGIFALFSRYEAFGLVYVEAMAHGVPVLTHRVGANASVLTKGAVLTDPYDADAAIAALVRLVDDPLERHRLGREGRSFVETTLSWDAVAARYRCLYAEALQERHASTIR